MQSTMTKFIYRQPPFLKIVIIALLLVILAGAGYYAFAFPRVPVISSQAFEEKYGIRVGLVAVTAAGGMLDVRLQITDGQKARALLQTPANFPVLLAAGKTLVVPADTRPSLPDFSSPSNYYLLFPNAAGAVHRGDLVSIRFGDLVLESIPAQ